MHTHWHARGDSLLFKELRRPGVVVQMYSNQTIHDFKLGTIMYGDGGVQMLLRSMSFSVSAVFTFT